MRGRNNKICPRCSERFSKRKINKLYHHLKYHHGVDSSNKRIKRK